MRPALNRYRTLFGLWKWRISPLMKTAQFVWGKIKTLLLLPPLDLSVITIRQKTHTFNWSSGSLWILCIVATEMRRGVKVKWWDVWGAGGPCSGERKTPPPPLPPPHHTMVCCIISVCVSTRVWYGIYFFTVQLWISLNCLYDTRTVYMTRVVSGKKWLFD